MKIYSLHEPSGEIRYIGKTKRSLFERLKGHIIESKNAGRYYRDNYKCRWVRSLLNQKLSPKIELICEVEGDGNREEIELIARHRALGARLVNATDGGEGVLNAPQEVRDKISRALFGRKATESHRINLAEGQRLRFEREANIVFQGERKTQSGWARAFGMSTSAMQERLASGESIESISQNRRRKIGIKPGQEPPNKLSPILSHLVGHKIGKLTIVDGIIKRIKGVKRWQSLAYILTQCECGKQSWKSYSTLIRGQSGCRLCGKSGRAHVSMPDGSNQQQLASTLSHAQT